MSESTASSAPDSERWSSLVVETAQRYAGCGIRHREFVRGKLRYDPMYAALLALLDEDPGAGIADLGCGRGIVLALLDTARRRRADDSRAAGALYGIDRSADAVAIARAALGERAEIQRGELDAWLPRSTDIVLVLDVLHYLSAEEQERLLARAATAVGTWGRLILREPDRDGGWRFQATRAAERARSIARWGRRQRFHYRSGSEWRALLASFGFEVRTIPSSSGTPFANLLFDARVSPDSRSARKT